MTDIILYTANYKLFEYEKTLAIKEIYSLLQPSNVEVMDGNYIVKSLIKSTKDLVLRAKKLTYFHGFKVKGHFYSTVQKELEGKCKTSGNSRRQSTRYGAHGLHEYKGKFNPQVVSALINIFQLTNNSLILDPFCGSGTVLLEACYKNINAIGVDINPMAVFITNTKLIAKNEDIIHVNRFLKNLSKRSKLKKNMKIENSLRINYLSSWLDEEHLIKFETLRNCILEVENESVRNILLCCASNMIRDYSLQEPADLRIRRRKSAMPKLPMMERFYHECTTFLANIGGLSITGDVHSEALIGDIRSDTVHRGNEMFDAAITSPPYATALPYIDTQRLSIIWLELAEPNAIKDLEWSLIGSREAKKSKLKELDLMLESNENSIPADLHELCITLKSALRDSDGFRRQAVPFLLYRYFSDMKSMFVNVHRQLKKNSPFALVVGHNHTALGGVRFDLDTPSYLCMLAEQVGWRVIDNMRLETYHRYGLHSKNAVNSESLLFLERS